METVDSKDLTLKFELMEDIIAPGAAKEFLNGMTDGAGWAAAGVGVVAGIIALT
ncbi:hypothetical protein JDS97_26985 [Bacillus cereus group sp. N18]|uniref:hypothetical protein n=1 Tax=Bacillus cereus group sp. N18 TaxID=2794590 RepID=UPI000893691D|nr:hypothetical protein [Bacillus cereus group sp. N18]OFC94532.1 hypothetical protein BTGOE5_51910 [Bacillus thuringiensis]HDR7325877.1 hypothetical protein [Bacillus toyonensis]MBJ8049881.1 hypothetical protein [Bacillus cereus group sp. N18]OFD02093.1 hypothetical protein BTGOE7_53650 [Bacillus thuringiensis]HDR7443134.1 hypothetical protein [Bacillus toyonensis]